MALVAGGVGSAPLLLLARRLVERDAASTSSTAGAAPRPRGATTFARLAERSGGELVATTEDGSAGCRGLVTEALDASGSPAGGYGSSSPAARCRCSPLSRALAAEHGVAGQAALETAMGCGFGACLGCAVPHLAGRFALCCKDGPVFRLDEVRW